MRLRSAFVFSTLILLLTALPIGCSEGTDVKIAAPKGEVKPSPPIPESELKGNARKAIGPGSSANMKRDPGASN
jgi:hypothetical protein